MRIVLIRHGKPKLPDFTRIKSAEMSRWIDAYNSANICGSSAPDESVMTLAQACSYIVCSDLSRSLCSAKILKLEDIQLISKEFREAGLPYNAIPWLRLSPNAWAVIFRLLWFMGFSSNSESFNDFKLRAKHCTMALEKAASENRDVIFVGHGFMNRFIAKNLLANGWSEHTKGGRGYWGEAVLEKEKPENLL